MSGEPAAQRGLDVCSAKSKQERLEQSLDSSNTGNRRGVGGKENIRAVLASPEKDDSDGHKMAAGPANNFLNVTPPGSPATPSTISGKRPRAVRGANRTKKTEQALKRLLVRGQQQQQHERTEEMEEDEAPLRQQAKRRRDALARGAKARGQAHQEKAFCQPVIDNAAADVTADDDSFHIKVKIVNYRLPVPYRYLK